MINGSRLAANDSIPLRNTSLSMEMELLGISLAKSAKTILEELGSSCGTSQDNDDEEVHGGQNPHETIQDVKDVIELGDSLSRIAWGTNAKDNRCYYIAGSGHTVKVKPKDESSNKDSVKKVEKYLNQWMTDNGWGQRQAEVSQRLDRHGEVLDILYYDEDDDKGLQLSFAEPLDMDEDPESIYQHTQEENLPFIDELGVRRKNNIMYTPIAYFIDGGWYDDFKYKSKSNDLADIPANRILIQHRKRNVLSSDQRGLTLYWPVREELTWAKKHLANLIRTSNFQAAFGAIRTINEIHGVDPVKSYLGTRQSGAVGGTPETYDMPGPSVVTVPSSIKYDFPETARGATSQIEVNTTMLRAAAAGMKLPEFMLTANVGEGNFASTLVSEGPFHKGMQFEQNLMVKEDTPILWQVLYYAASKNLDGLTKEDVDSVVLEIKPPRVQTRNRKEDFEVNEELWEKGQLSGKSLLASEDRDFEAEQAQIAIERKTEHPAPIAVSGPLDPATTPGPKVGIKGDGMTERGVMTGEPRETPEK